MPGAAGDDGAATMTRPTSPGGTGPPAATGNGGSRMRALEVIVSGATIIFVPILSRRSVLIAFGALGALIVGVTHGRASTAALPSLYVNYDTQCHFTMALDGGA